MFGKDLTWKRSITSTDPKRKEKEEINQKKKKKKKKEEVIKVMSLEMFSVCLLKGSWWTLLSSMQPPRHRPGPEGRGGSKPSLLEALGGLPLQRASEPRSRTKASPKHLSSSPQTHSHACKTTARLEGGTCLKCLM